MDVSKIIREVRMTVQKLPAWRFVALTLIGLIFALGYLAGNLPWESLLPQPISY